MIRAVSSNEDGALLRDSAGSTPAPAMTEMYDVFLIDPPWAIKRGGKKRERTRTSGMALPYDTMSTQAIFALLDAEVLSLATERHVVFLWVIEKYLHEAESLMLERGYKRHARIVWRKPSGIPAAFTLRFSHEYLVWYYKPTLLPIATEMRGKLSSVWDASPREHSQKPEVAYANIARLYPSARKLDVFSRQPRSGWGQWGDQPDHFDAMTQIDMELSA
jgi:N6-adenosine-specific RNA methylase IME4